MKDEFIIVSEATYARMQSAYPDVFDRVYSDIRQEYEALKCEYEDLRRPFYATPDAPYTDVWDFATVNTYPGKHICEKPLDMAQHIVRVSSRPGALVLDPFCGSGNLLRGAYIEGRHYLGCDNDPQWARKAADWIPQPFDVLLPMFGAEQP
jgi:site-specific DNA-methyltransferase (adenine-specific)